MDLQGVLDRVGKAFVEAHRRAAFAEGSLCTKVFVDVDGDVWVESMSCSSRLDCEEKDTCLEVWRVAWGWGFEIEGAQLFRSIGELEEFLEGFPREHINERVFGEGEKDT